MVNIIRQTDTVSVSTVYGTIAQIQNNKKLSAEDFQIVNDKAYELVRVSYNALADVHTFELPKVSEEDKQISEKLKTENKEIEERIKRFNSRFVKGAALVCTAGLVVYNLVAEPKNPFIANEQLPSALESTFQSISQNFLPVSIGLTSFFLCSSIVTLGNTPQSKQQFKQNAEKIQKIGDNQNKYDESARLLGVLDKMLTNFEQANPGRDYPIRPALITL